jgi:hypothetical protein
MVSTVFCEGIVNPIPSLPLYSLDVIAQSWDDL